MHPRRSTGRVASLPGKRPVENVRDRGIVELVGHELAGQRVNRDAALATRLDALPAAVGLALEDFDPPFL